MPGEYLDFRFCKQKWDCRPCSDAQTSVCEHESVRSSLPLPFQLGRGAVRKYEVVGSRAVGLAPARGGDPQGDLLEPGSGRGQGGGH